jgi:uncharacterized membrane protein
MVYVLIIFSVFVFHIFTGERGYATKYIEKRVKPQIVYNKLIERESISIRECKAAARCLIICSVPANL